MSIIRIKKEDKYSVISNAPLNDKALSWEARGIMAYLLTKPDGWECRNYDLVNQGPAGEHAIKRILKELREAGYIHRGQISKGRGKIEWVTEIYEAPSLNPHFTTGDFTTVVNIEAETFGDEKSADIVSTDNSKYLSTENTDINGSAENPSKYSPEKKAALNLLVPYLVSISDIQDKDDLINVTLLGYEVAQICKRVIPLTSIATLKTIARVTIALNTKKITGGDLKNFEIWWYNEPWEGQKGQAPTPGQLGDMWGQFEASQMEKSSNSNGPILTSEQEAQLEYCIAQDVHK